MKNLFVLLLVLVSFANVNADPAKKVKLSYEQGKLKVQAVHPVKDVNDHYIDQIIVLVDGKEVKKAEFTSQSSKEALEYVLELPNLKSGTVVTVKTRCNEFGNKSGKLTVGSK